MDLKKFRSNCLQESKCYQFNNSYISIIAYYDRSSGRKNRYTVLALTDSDPIVIGRELDLPLVRKMVKIYGEISNQLVLNKNFSDSGTKRFIMRCVLDYLGAK